MQIPLERDARRDEHFDHGPKEEPIGDRTRPVADQDAGAASSPGQFEQRRRADRMLKGLADGGGGIAHHGELVLPDHSRPRPRRQPDGQMASAERQGGDGGGCGLGRPAAVSLRVAVGPVHPLVSRQATPFRQFAKSRLDLARYGAWRTGGEEILLPSVIPPRRTLGFRTAWLMALAFVAAAAGEESPAPLSAAASAPPLRPKVVIVAYFEVGDDTGDRAGELQLWVEREHLDRIIKVPGVFDHVRANRDGSIIALKVGPLSINPAVNITALGNSPLFDLRQSYWLLQGIAGVTPAHGTIGSAVWTDFVVDGDAVREIDARELPPGWETGSYPLNANRPYPNPRVPAGGPEDVRTWTEPAFHISARHDVVRLNPVLTAWAFGLTRGIAPPDTTAMKQQRAAYTGFDAALPPPSVLVGGELSTERFWVGGKMDDWANRWMSYMTDGCSVMLTTSQNDIGSLVALESLRQAGRADPDRVLLLRTASNFDRPPPQVDLADFLAAEQHGSYTGFDAAIEALYQVGSPVVHRLLEAGPVR